MLNPKAKAMIKDTCDWHQKNEPNATPGQTPCPAKSKPAKAIPAEGHKGEASKPSPREETVRYAPP
jgi:hypothetical protein